MPTTYINFHAPINLHTTQILMGHISLKLTAKFDDFYIMFSTPGGEVSSGITLYNFLRDIPATVTMHNTGNVDSSGNVAFLAADTRYACSNSTFMYHGVYWNVGNMRLVEQNTRQYLRMILADQARMGDIVVNRTAIKSGRIKKFFREAATIDAKQALVMGIIHEIADANIPNGADLISFAFQP